MSVRYREKQLIPPPAPHLNQMVLLCYDYFIPNHVYEYYKRKTEEFAKFFRRKGFQFF
jgi:hypothetical protein